MLRSSALRLAALYSAIMLVGVSVLLSVVFVVSQRTIANEIDLIVRAESEAMRDEFQFNGIDDLTTVLKQRVDEWGRIGAVYLLVDASGRRVAGNLSGWPQAASRNGEWLEFELNASEGAGTVEHPVRADVLSLGDYQLLIGTDVSEQNRVIGQMRAATAWGIGLTTLLTAITAWWYSRRIAARVSGVAAACENIMSGDLAQRLPGDGSRDEFDQLTTTVNHMLDRVEHQSAVLRTTFGSAAHDLRTPLQRMRMRLESSTQSDPAALPPPLLVETLRDIDSVQRTLGTLLQIAHAESGAASQLAAVIDIAALAAEIVDLYLPVARQRGVRLSVAVAGPARIAGNRQLLAQLLVNLLENALKFVPAQGQIRVQVSATDGQVQLEVSDDGPGMSAERRAEALAPHRGAREVADGSGGGLGLRLVAAVTHLHQGRLSLHDNHPGLRACCEFRLLAPAVAAVAP
jgi:signal transduction histidine kinase